MPQVIRNSETGQQAVGDGPVPEGWEVVTNPQPVTRFAPVSMAGQDSGPSVSTRASGPLQAAVEAAPRMVMPTAGSILGGAVGARFGGTPGQLVGESIGSAAGTGANMLTGLEEPSLKGLGAAAAMPFAGRAIGGVLRGGAAMLGKIAPGSAAARHEIAVATMNAIPDLIRPGTPSGALYSELERVGQTIPIRPDNLRKTVGELLDNEAKASAIGLRDTTRESMLAAMSDAIADPNKTLPFTDYWAGVKRLGEKVGALQTSGGEALGAAKLLYRAAQKDLATAESPTYPLLKAANDAYKRELATEELQKVVTTQGIVPRAGNLIQVRAEPIRKWLQTSEEAKFIDPEQRSSLEETLAKISALPSLPPRPGVNVGSAMMLGKLATGGAIGQHFGGATGAMTGTALAYWGNQLAARALMSDRGRKALMAVLDTGPFLDYPRLAALAVAVNAGLKSPPEPQ